jgi:hypothetical protein
MNRRTALGIAAGALALTVAGGSVYAAAPQSARQAAAAQTTPTPAAPSGKQQRKQQRQAARAQRKLAGALARATADTTGLSPREIAQGLRGGKSLAQIAQSKGKSADAVVAAARAKLAGRLDKAVADKKITRERADAALAAFDRQAPALMNSTELGKPARRGRRG